VRILVDDLVNNLLDRVKVRDLFHPSLLDDGSRVAALVPNNFEQIFGDLAGNRAVLDQIEHLTKLSGRYRRHRNIFAFLVQTAEQFIDHPVRRRFAVAAFGNRFEIVRGFALSDQHAGIVSRHRELTYEARLLLVWQFGKIFLQFIDIGLVKFKWQQIRIRKVPVIVCLFLRTHRPRLTPQRIEQARILLYLAALLDDLDLPTSLMLDCLANKADRIDILDFATRPKRLSRSAHRDIDVGAQVSFFHIAVAGAEVAQDRPQLRDESFGFLRRSKVGL